VKGDEQMQKIIYKTKDDDHIAKETANLLKTRSAASKILNIYKNEQNKLFIKAQTMSNKMIMNRDRIRKYIK
jgi:hypothetical protein